MPTRTWLPAALAVLAAARLGAQTVTMSKLDEPTYRYAVTEQRRQIFASNVPLFNEERDRFWKVYDEYAKEREPLDKERFSLLERYAQSFASINDEQAMALALASGRLQLTEIELRLKYAAVLRKKMSGRIAARFFQIDDYVTTALSRPSGAP
jgi:hypothetical protein